MDPRVGEVMAERGAKVRDLFEGRRRAEEPQPEPAPDQALWRFVKESVDAWDRTMTPVFDTWLKHEGVVDPAGRVLTAASRARGAQQRVLRGLWRELGLPTRSAQERLLAAVQRLETRVVDQQETIAELRAELKAERLRRLPLDQAPAALEAKVHEPEVSGKRDGER